ncbi:hypothetical protein [Flagellimonas pacifica]|uniref:Uncharacterized protein n=1 Tax=Flagellimonas pacifica TaxID=1247520 RepID=A0A285MAM4_9FLAO|nr:hypothetical protein [Allomuricauda parva]SNY94205.1 hypothetical protein SAMN06265377_0076 [Allomuricauda parva]SNY94344.1 hypothetical protein SAMN06265377_0084 [Allomuricauda parva]
MVINKKSDWFKENIMSYLSEFEVIEKKFSEGDFGDLEQIEFNSEKISGNIDFWSLGWVGVFVWDNICESEMLNILSEPQEEERIVESFNKLKEIIINN